MENSHPEEVQEAQISVSELLIESFARLKDHESIERDDRLTLKDITLTGLILLVKELLVCYSKQADYQEVLKVIKEGNYL